MQRKWIGRTSVLIAITLMLCVGVLSAGPGSPDGSVKAVQKVRVDEKQKEIDELARSSIGVIRPDFQFEQGEPPRGCDDCLTPNTDLGVIGETVWGYSVAGDCATEGKWYASFTGEAGYTYWFDLCDEGSAVTDIDIKICDSTCAILAGQDGPYDCDYHPDDFTWDCTVGGTYYVVIAPYRSYNQHNCTGDASDTFTLAYYKAGACDVVCPPEGIDENEPDCGQPTDTVNGGCNSDPPVFSSISCGETICGTSFYDGSTRDTDWYELVLTQDMDVTVTIEAEFVVVAGFVNTCGVADCDAATGISPYVLANECYKDSVTACLHVGTWWIFVGPDFDENDAFPCGAEYVLSVDCVPCTPDRGACCLPDGSCIPDLTQCQCEDPAPGGLAGVWQGAGISCDPNPCPQPQPGDNCYVPIVMTLPADLPYADLNQTNCGRDDNYADTCLGSYDGGEDIIYELVINSAVDIEITLDPKTTTWTGIALDDSCPPDADCIASSTNSSASPHGTGCVHLEPGTYYVMVDTYPTPDCVPDFDLTIVSCSQPTGRCCYLDGGVVTCVVNEEAECDVLSGIWDEGLDCTEGCPIGRCCYDDPVQCADNHVLECDALGGDHDEALDCTTPCPEPFAEDCDTAKVISAVPYIMSFDNDTATADGPDATCDKYYPTTSGLMQNDAWWVWTATEDCYATVTATPDAAGTYDVVMTVRDNCTDLTELYCADDNDGGEAETILFGAVSGVTYYFQVGDTGSYEGGGECVFELTCETQLYGACCDEFGGCTETIEADCTTGLWMAGLDCDPNPCPQPGDNCDNPLAVLLGLGDLPYTDTNTNCGRGDDHDDPSTAHCLYYYDSGEEIIYELTVTEAMDVTITLDPKGTTYPGVAIGVACPPTDDCIEGGYHSTSDPVVIGVYPDCISLVPGTTYYIQVDTWSTPDCIPDFDLTIALCEAPMGACCVGADCVATTTEDDCTTTYGGDWYEGEDCATFTCPAGCPEDEIKLVIDTDGYGSETTWEMLDPNGTVMCSGGPYGNYEHHEEICCIGYTECYDVFIYDSYGDGGPDYEVYFNDGLVTSGTLSGYGGLIVSLGGGCPTGACCIAGDCVATNTQADCLILGGDWFEGEDCATFSCPCEGNIYWNGAPDGVNALHNDRWDDDTHAWRIVDDVTFTEDVIINDLHWWGNEPTTFNWSDQTVDFIILADSGGAPGAVIISVDGYPASRYDTGDVMFGDPVWFYSIEGIYVSLPAGTYWFGMRVVQNQPYGTGQFDHGWWCTAPNNGTSLYYVDNDPPDTFVIGETYEAVAFCITNDGCGDLDGDGTVDNDDYALFVAAYGECGGDPAYLITADYDGDGCITAVDYQAWVQCYRNANPPPKSKAIDMRPGGGLNTPDGGNQLNTDDPS